MVAPTISDLRRVFFGAGVSESNVDAEYRTLLAMSEDGINLSGIGNASGKRHVRRPAGWGGQWKIGREAAGSRVVGVDIWGDSISADGTGASVPRTLGTSGLIQTALQAEYGDGGSGYLSAWAYTTKTGTWTLQNGFGGSATRAAVAGSLQWTGIVGTTLRLFYRNAGIVGEFRWRVDGGAWTNVPGSGGFNLDPVSSDKTGLSDIAHTVDVEWVSGECIINGIYAERAAGVNIRRFGVSGRASAHYSRGTLGLFTATTNTGTPTTITCAAPGWFNSSLIDKYISGAGIPFSAKITAVASAVSLTIDKNVTASATVEVDIGKRDSYGNVVPSLTQNNEPFLNSPGCGRPDAIILMTIANDASINDVTARDTRDGLSTMMRPFYSGSLYAANPSLITVIEHNGNWFDIWGRYPEMAGVAAAFSEGLGGATVDSWGIGRRSHQYLQDQGWIGADPIHPTDLGHLKLYAEPILDILLADDIPTLV